LVQTAEADYFLREAVLLAANAAPTDSKRIESSSETVTLIAGGDVVWTPRVAKPSYYFGVEDKKSRYSKDGWRSIPYVAAPFWNRDSGGVLRASAPIFVQPSNMIYPFPTRRRA